jgi:DNA uptake protein ComE-like DNA-binding protein
MSIHRLFSTLCVVCLACSGMTLVGRTQAPATAPTAKATPLPKPSRKKFNQAPAAATLVDLNKAAKGELKKLPGITDAYADKIIAGRPYRSKAHLVTHRILPMETYMAIKNQVVVNLKKP